MKVSRRLIRQQQRRFVNHRSGNANQLLLPTRELVGEQILLANDVEPIQRVRHQGLALGARNVFVGEGQIDVFGYGEIVEKMVALEDHADAAARQVSALLAMERVDCDIFE